jgi:hypothetical protein
MGETDVDNGIKEHFSAAYWWMNKVMDVTTQTDQIQLVYARAMSAFL